MNSDSHSFSEIPIVDFGGFRSGSFDAIEMAQYLREICHHIGFFIAINHGVSRKVVDSTFAISRQFFALEIGKKRLIDKRKSRFFRGWEREGAEHTNNHPDIREQVDLWTEHPPHSKSITPAYLRLLGPNQWLPESVLPGYRSTLDQWFSEAGTLADRLISLLALGLDLPGRYFEERFGNQRMSLTKLIRYPKTPETQYGVNPHKDTGFITLLAAGDTPGLEIKNAADDWIAVPVIPDAFVVNLGEMLQAMSGNYYIATQHRVFSQAERYSLGYFHGPSLETELTVAPLRPEFLEAVKQSPRHFSAGFMATPEETKIGVAEMTGKQNAMTYGDQMWNYFRRSYPENMKKHYGDA